MKIAKNCLGKTKDTTVYCLFNDSLSKVFDIELTVPQAKKLAARKDVEVLSWMQVLSGSDEKQKLGIHAQEVKSVKELN